MLLWLDGATFVVCHLEQLTGDALGVATLVGHASNDHRECLECQWQCCVAYPELTVARTSLLRRQGCTTTGSLSGSVAVSDKLSESMSAMWTTGVALLANISRTALSLAGMVGGTTPSNSSSRLRSDCNESVGDALPKHWASTAAPVRNDIRNLNVTHPTLDTIEGVTENVGQLVPAVPMMWHNLATS